MPNERKQNQLLVTKSTRLTQEQQKQAYVLRLWFADQPTEASVTLYLLHGHGRDPKIFERKTLNPELHDGPQELTVSTSQDDHPRTTDGDVITHTREKM
jgi:hypothetical protein